MTYEDEEFSRVEMESRIRKEGMRTMKVEGALHVVCQCDKCKAQPEKDPVAWESLLGAVARGWCYEANANKTMDSDLAVAIAKEVQALYNNPTQRTWVWLPEAERDHIIEHYGADLGALVNRIQVRMMELNA
jgi:hypothetical protein